MARHSKLVLLAQLALAAASASCGDGGGPGRDAGAEAGLDARIELPEILPCGPERPGALAGCVSRERYVDDLTFVAEPRAPGSDHWQAVQDLCATRFDELGYAVERQSYGTGVNVVGTLEGTQRPEETVVVTAHYDHIPGCAGADDNASGVAALLETARILAMAEWGRTVELVCADEEEVGLVGSAAYVERAIAAGREIVVAFVYDSLGVARDEPGTQQLEFGIDMVFPDLAAELEANEYRADFFLVLADSLAHDPAALVSLYGDSLGRTNGVMELGPEIRDDPFLGDLRRADHASFWAADLPAILLNDTTYLRYPCYHCLGCADEVSRLDHGFAADVIAATVGSIATILAE